MSDNKQQQNKFDVLIIGSGPAGYSAGIYSSRAALNTAIFSGTQPGGQLTITTDVENYPGYVTILGPDLMEQMKLQAVHTGVSIINDTIMNVDLNNRPFRVYGDSGKEYIAKTIIIATGAQAKWLGLASEEKFKGYGVSGCATCDGFFYRGKEVLVVGGGNTAVEEALYLTKHASKVTLIHRRDSLRAEKILQKRLFENPKIHIIWDTALEEVMGSEQPLSVTGAKIKNLKTHDITEIKVDGVFIAIGHKPNTSLFSDILSMDTEGYIITEPDSTKTSVEGIYAAGDVQDKIFRQAVTAAGTGCMAALEAQKYLQNN